MQTQKKGQKRTSLCVCVYAHTHMQTHTHVCKRHIYSGAKSMDIILK